MNAKIYVLMTAILLFLTACGSPAEVKPTATTGIIPDSNFGGTWRNDTTREKVHIWFPPDGVKVEAWNFDTGEQFVVTNIQYSKDAMVMTIERPSTGVKETSTFVPRDGKLVETQASQPGVEIEWLADY
jgi:hypothetical protein